MDDSPPAAGATRFTERLRLEPVDLANAPDLWLVHNDDEVSYWYDTEKPSLEEAERRAAFMGDSWRFHGVHKWIAYDRVSGEVVGRGGLSRTPIDDDWGQIYAFLPAGRGCASRTMSPPIHRARELARDRMGAAARVLGARLRLRDRTRRLAFAFDVLGVHAVVSCTVRHNVRSRAVMERIGMRYAGEIRSRGIVEGTEGERDDAPFAVCVLLRRDWNR